MDTGVEMGASSRDGDNEFDITELSKRTGMTARNIRAHQSRGLLAPPRRQGRIGLYGPEHEARIRRIQDLQDRGFNLASIRALLVAEDDDDGRDLQRMALAPLLRHEPMVVPRSALWTMFNHHMDDANFRAALDHGLLNEVNDGLVELPSQAVAAAAVQLIEMGFDAGDLLELQVTFVRSVSSFADRFVDLCLQHAWDPFAEEGYPADRWGEVVAAFERFLDQISVVLMSTFSWRVRAAAERRLSDGEGRAARRTAPAGSGTA